MLLFKCPVPESQTVKTDNRNTEKISSTSASSHVKLHHHIEAGKKNAVGFDGSTPFKNKVHLKFTLLIASSQESNLCHSRECEILSLSALNVTAAAPR
jgi:hypothetical protein